MSQNPTPSLLDPGQILKRAYDEAEDRIRVETGQTIVLGSADIIVDAANDSIKIGDGLGNYASVNSDGTTNVRVSNSFITSPFDYVSGAYPSGTTEVYTYKTGGAGGTVVGTITVTYTDSLKTDIQTIVKS